MLAKFSCGCIGVPSENLKKTMVLKICDNDIDQESIGVTWRDMEGKNYEDLAETEEKELFLEIGSLIGDGYAFREVQRLLARKTASRD